MITIFRRGLKNTDPTTCNKKKLLNQNQSRVSKMRSSKVRFSLRQMTMHLKNTMSQANHLIQQRLKQSQKDRYPAILLQRMLKPDVPIYLRKNLLKKSQPSKSETQTRRLEEYKRELRRVTKRKENWILTKSHVKPQTSLEDYHVILNLQLISQLWQIDVNYYITMYLLLD